MKRQMAAIVTGTILAMSAITLPAFAKVSPTNTQPSVAKQQQQQVLRTTGTGMQQQKWSITDKGAIGRLTPSEQAKFKQFKAGIERGLSPQAAAKKVGITKVTRLASTNNRSQKSTSDRYQMRLSLSKKTSATLRVNEQSKVVKVVRVGSNVKPIKTLSKTTTARYQKSTTARNQSTTARNQTRPSNRQTASAPVRVKGQTKVVKANFPAGNNVKPTPTSSQNQPVLPR